jgi:hypothetical protein
MFTISSGRGFQITFDNGYTVSVQWGNGNYCTNRDGENGFDSRTAEVAVYREDERNVTDINSGFYPINGERVRGWQTPEQVAKLIQKVAEGDMATGFTI